MPCIFFIFLRILADSTRFKSRRLQIMGTEKENLFWDDNYIT